MNVTKENLQTFLGWCVVLNLAILVCWFLAFVFAHDFVFRIHSWWFEISEEGFDEIHYTAITCYKLAVFLFYLTPYLVLRFAKLSLPRSGND